MPAIPSTLWLANSTDPYADQSNQDGNRGGGSIVLPTANLYINTYETELPNDPSTDTINFAFSTLHNDLVTDGTPTGVNGAQVYTGSGGVQNPHNAVSNKNWIAYESDISMRVSCAIETGGTQNSEQNASCDKLTATETWVRYWMRIPTNYAPTTDHINSQHKLFVAFQDGYSQNGYGSTAWMNMYRNDATGMMRSALIQREGTSGSSGGVGSQTDLFNFNTDKGKWMQFVILIRLESSLNANDGEHKFWARFDGDSSFALQNSATGLNLVRSNVAGEEGLSNFRFLSAREGNSTERQDFLFDVIEVADTPLVPAGTAGL